MIINYTIQDLFGSFLAFLIFALVFVFPGYVFGWVLNLFEFRRRLPVVRYLLGIVLSNAFSPILLFLVYHFLGATSAILVLMLFALAWAIIQSMSHRQHNTSVPFPVDKKGYLKIATLIAGIWVIFSIFLLIDVQFGQRLYFSIVAYDYSTRVAVIDAITRTGVPPVNPGYFPGHPVLLTQLYYFWYILGSLVDQLGGSWVSPQHAMIASVSWVGLVLMATLALYLRLRNNNRKIGFWRTALLSPKLLMISGLDAIPIIIINVAGRLVLGYTPLDGHNEGWNMPVMSWMNALAWVPHHIAGALACLTALLAFQYVLNKDKKQLPFATLITGIAFASSVGLSFWTMFVFAFFWVLWIVVLYLKREDRKVLLMMVLAAILGLLLDLPFLLPIFISEGSGSTESLLPLKVYVRPFILSTFFNFLPHWALNLINLLSLPLNYLFELGFYFVITMLWINKHKVDWGKNTYYHSEGLLVLTVLVLLSFFRSTIIVINDLGIRPWLLGQFIMVVWAIDLLQEHVLKKDRTLLSYSVLKNLHRSSRFGAMLTMMFYVGILTTSLEIISIRLWPIFVDMGVAGFPTSLSKDNQLGRRTYDARTAYEYIDKNLPKDTVIQYNPISILDRPSGLYGNHQMAISDRTAYGISKEELQNRTNSIAPIFQDDTIGRWDEIDKLCYQSNIDVLVIKDTDPIWKNVEKLTLQRPALYRNQFYAVVSCGYKIR